MSEQITHHPNGMVSMMVTLTRDDIELAKLYLREKPDDWINIVKQFRDSGRTFAEATSIVYLARKELDLIGGSHVVND